MCSGSFLTRPSDLEGQRLRDSHGPLNSHPLKGSSGPRPRPPERRKLTSTSPEIESDSHSNNSNS